MELKSLLNKTIVVGITYFDANGYEIGKKQFAGIITKADKKSGIEVFNKSTNSIITLPPDLTAIESAQPGIYTLKSTGETVTDPDYTSTWIFTQGC